jgi:hypothetical protein
MNLVFALILIGAVLWAVGVPYAGLLVLIGVLYLCWLLIQGEVRR